MGALVNALRLSYPMVDALVGDEFFDRTCRIFAEANLPRAASLAVYGEGFADFLADFAPAAGLPYLSDVARLDRAVEIALRAPAQQRRFVGAVVSMDLPQSLAVLRLTYPVDEIRAALGDDEAMAAIVTMPAERFVLVWRKGFDAAVQRIAPAGGFLARVARRQGAEVALAAARTEHLKRKPCEPSRRKYSPQFCTIISNPEELSP